MKKIVVSIVMIMVCIGYCHSQDIGHKIDGKDPKFFVLPNLQLIPKTGQTAVTLGGTVAYSPLPRFFVGFMYNGVVNDFMPLTEEDTRKRLTSRWGGLSFDYMFLNDETVKIYASSSLGFGELDIVADQEGVLPDEKENYTFAKLGLLIDIPVYRSFYASIGWNYRFVSEIDYKNVSDRDIEGISGQIGIRYLFLR